VVDGGAGADTLTGGAGNDTYVVDNAGDRVTEAASGGIDLVQSSITHTLAAEVENLTLTGTAAINGTGNALANAITGNSGANVLDGGAGADTLDGGAGADTLNGGADNDTYVVDNAADRVIELAGGGIDLVQSSITYTLAAEVENLTLTGTAAINGTGNALGNVITGNSGSNRLHGGAGNDTLTGGGGRDVLTGGTGADVFRYEALLDSRPSANRWDVITDFSGGDGDRIDLSALDAHSGLSGDEAFSFIGVEEFSAVNASGQLRFEYDDELGMGFLYGSSDADDDAEFAVLLRGVNSLQANDFIL
jgi:Ca2+-binding RTX toxin-like protein